MHANLAQVYIVVLEGDSSARPSAPMTRPVIICARFRLQPCDAGGPCGIDAVPKPLMMLAVPFVVDAVTVSVPSDWRRRRWFRSPGLMTTWPMPTSWVPVCVT